MKPALFGLAPTAENPVDGLYICASVLEALEAFVDAANSLEPFQRHGNNEAMDGLSFLLNSVRKGVTRSADVLSAEHIMRNRDSVSPGAVEHAEKTLARLNGGGT